MLYQNGLKLKQIVKHWFSGFSLKVDQLYFHEIWDVNSGTLNTYGLFMCKSQNRSFASILCHCFCFVSLPLFCVIASVLEQSSKIFWSFASVLCHCFKIFWSFALKQKQRHKTEAMTQNRSNDTKQRQSFCFVTCTWSSCLLQ